MDNLAFIALGSNLGNSREIVRGAMERLQSFTEEPVLKSSLWRTTPVDCPADSPDFINAVIALVPLPGETPESLLAKLQAVEREFGRRPKTVLNEARPLDLDLIAFANVARQTESLTLPHPRAHLRKFVLQPLNEIAPDFVFPGSSQTISNLLADLETRENVIRVG